MSAKRLEMLDAMIAKGSSDPFHHYARAMELRSLGRDAEALEAFAGVVVRFADYVPTYLMAAQLADKLGQKDRARELADRGIETARRRGDGHAESELVAFRGTLT